jgi:hypothetical protein
MALFMSLWWRVLLTFVLALVGVCALTAVAIVALTRQRLHSTYAVISVVSAVAVWALLTIAPAGGDRDGHILDALRPVVAAVPEGATHLLTQATDSSWSPACPDNPTGRAGWGSVTVSAMFYSALPRANILSRADIALSRLDWHEVSPRFEDGDGQYAPLADWTKLIPHATAIHVVIFADAPVSGCTVGECKANWEILAHADPPGFAEPGC